MKKLILICLLFTWGLLAQAQAIYNNGARIVSTTGSYWIIGGGAISYSGASNITEFDNLVISNDAKLKISSLSKVTVNGIFITVPLKSNNVL